MPTFDLAGWPQVHAPVAGFRIMATMYYPVDGERRTELHATLAFTYYDTIRNDPSVWEQQPTLTELYPLFHVRHLGGSQAEVFQRAREVACRGSVAGEALIIIRQMAEHGQDGSVNKACDILAKAGKAGRLTGGHTLIPYANSKALRAEAWVPYRSVAHLWAAHNLLWSFRWNETPDGERPRASWYENSSDLERFLALAEDFRQWGEGYIPHARHKEVAPLLSPYETWRIPAETSVAKVCLTPPRLGPWYEQFLQTYNSRRPAKRGRTRKSRQKS
jgi:hypothetical protein